MGGGGGGVLASLVRTVIRANIPSSESESWGAWTLNPLQSTRRRTPERLAPYVRKSSSFRLRTSLADCRSPQIWARNSPRWGFSGPLRSLGCGLWVLFPSFYLFLFVCFCFYLFLFVFFLGGGGGITSCLHRHDGAAGDDSLAPLGLEHSACGRLACRCQTLNKSTNKP